MKIINTITHYGLISILLHWATAILLAIILPLGLIMVELGYYDSGYTTYPHIHKSLGLILFFITAFRLLWVMLISKPPAALPQPKLLEILAKAIHHMMYLCLLVVLISGYLISTADGRGIDLFNWLTVPAFFKPFNNQADLAGEVHLFAAWGLVGLVALHAAGALKHQFIDKDKTLLRIFGR